ncbi:MAG: dihydrolipoyl dehydrogenase [Methanomassiliicoccales archaeon]
MDYDAVVVGGGPGGYPCAIRLAQYGLRTALVERATLGGECLNFGCIPSKSIIRTALEYEQTRRLVKEGILNGEVGSVSWDGVMKRKEAAVHKLTSGVEQLLKANGVTVIRGTARFSEKGKLEIDGQPTEARNVVIATGTTFADLPALRFDHKLILDVRDLLQSNKLPSSLLIVGGGYIGAEMGLALASLGCKVTIVEIMERILPGLDNDVFRVVQRGLEAAGMVIHAGATVKNAVQNGSQVEVEFAGAASGKHLFDAVLVSVGKRADTSALNLSSVGVGVDEKGFIRVDQRCCTSVPWIFAVGDVTGPPFLAHRATYMGKVAAGAIAGKAVAMDAVVPSVIFTNPEVASVGLTEAEATARGLHVRTAKFPFAASGRAVTMEETDGFVKIVSDEHGTVLGIQIVGPDASELLGEACLAVEMGATVEDLALIVHAHPTLPEALGEAADVAEGFPLDIAPARRK